MSHILEAQCGRCGETFNPDSDQDLMHEMDSKGVYCGGHGELLGEYDSSRLPPTYEDMEAQAAYDDFWGGGF